MLLVYIFGKLQICDIELIIKMLTDKLAYLILGDNSQLW